MSCREGVGQSAGFTLLEVLLAVTILGIAYLAIMQNFSMSLQNIERLDRNGGQLFMAQLELEKHFLGHNLGEEVAGEVFVEGGKYMIVLAEDESGKLTTLSLKEL
ncbi:MAG: type II secretion system protein [Thermodesulfobacteriota bacterium]